MGRAFAIVALALAALALDTATSGAAPTFGAAVYGAFNTYAMTDVNEDIVRPLNRLFLDLEEIHHGFTGGLEARLWARPSVMVSAGWEPIFASTDDSGWEFDFRANVIPMSVAYFLTGNGHAKYGLAAGIDYLWLAGHTSRGGAIRFEGDATGSALGLHILGSGEWTVSPGLALTAGAGYRMARVGGAEVEVLGLGGPVAMEVEADYSGFVVRAGLALSLPMR